MSGRSSFGRRGRFGKKPVMREYLHSFAKLEFDKVLARLTSFAVTELGKSKIQTLQPFATLAEIQTALKSVTEMKYLLEADTQPSFEGIVDCRASIHRASITGNVLSAPELRQIGNLLTATRKLKTFFEKRKNLAPLLASQSGMVEVDKILEFNIHTAINENGDVRDNASNQLRQIRKSILNLRETLRKQLESILRQGIKNDWAQEEIVTTREGRMVIPVKVEHKHQIPGFIHSSSSSGATVFIEPAETLELNNEIRSLLFEEEREIQHILKGLTEQVSSKTNELFVVIRFLENLDMVYAKALYSIAIHGAQLNIQPNPHLSLLDARHPLLVDHQSRSEVIPLSIEAGKDFHTILLSGPNAGGKSVALKTVGLICVMVHHGMHAPASPDSSIPLFDSIFVDIGDEQSIENNLSTFTSHLGKLKVICELSTSSSIVLIDEICAGTDPSEGGALAAAVLKELTDRKCLTITTTHNSFLKAFATTTRGIINASMDFNQETLTPTYRFLLGHLGSSYAFEIANRLKISENLIFQAKTILSHEARQLSEVVATLEREANKLKHEQEVFNNNNMYLKKLIEEYESKHSTLKKELTELKKQALQDARKIIDQSSSLLERSIREVKEHPGERSTVRKVREQLKHHTNEVQNLLQEIEHDSAETTEFSIGDFVRFKEGSEVGEVVDIIRNNIIIQIKNVKVKVAKDRLTHVNTPSEKGSKFGHPVLSPTPNRIIDVRGMIGDDAVSSVDKSIDGAILSGLTKIEIIHGKGAGSLRKKIHDFLSNHSQVLSYRVGEWNEGGVGVTVVELL